MSADLRTIPTDQIRPNTVALRNVDKESEAYENLARDVRRRGVLNAITVREKEDGDEQYFELIDGLHRFSAACDSGLSEIPCQVLNLSDSEIDETQIVANLVKVETRPVEYTKALNRMLSREPTLTVSQLAERVSQSPTYIMNRFSLLKLDESIQELVDKGEISVTNAVALSKLPREEQHNWTDAAMTQKSSEFVPAANKRIKELRDAKREGRKAKDQEWSPTPHARKMKELKAEYENAEVGPALCVEFDAKTPSEGFALAIKWVLNLDPHSVEAQRVKHEEAKKLREEEKAKRKAERERKRAEEAAEKAAKAEAEAGLSA